MTTFTYTIKDEVGIHARPAGLLVKEAAKYGCTIKISKGSKSVDAKKLFAVMSLGAKCGEEITVSCDGEGEETAAAAMESFISANL